MVDVANKLVREEHESYRIPPIAIRVSEPFEAFVAMNPELVVEQNSNGEILILSPAGSESARRNAEISFQLHQWCKNYGGVAFDSSGLFTLPDGSKRGPDASWIADNRWHALSWEDRESFAPICPDFVIELHSRTDRLIDLKQKMSDYVANGVRLGWLVDPYARRIYVYRQGCEMEVLPETSTCSGEGVLPGFVLDLAKIWET
jgi:Uma2 family endonuclease